MQFNGTSVLDRPEVAQVSPVIEGPKWFEATPGAALLRMNVPLTAAQMAAVLYFEPAIEAGELADDGEVWGQVACVLASYGMCEVERRVTGLACEVRCGEVAAPEWLTFVRSRVAEVTGGTR